MAKSKAKKLSKGERVKLRIKKATERADRELQAQIAKIQGVKSAHADKTTKLRERLKEAKTGRKAAVKTAREAAAKKFEGKLAKLAKRHEDKVARLEKKHVNKTAKAVAKAVRTAQRDGAKKLKKLGRFLKLANQLNAEAKPRSQSKIEPAVEAKPLQS